MIGILFLEHEVEIMTISRMPLHTYAMSLKKKMLESITAVLVTLYFLMVLMETRWWVFIYLMNSFNLVIRIDCVFLHKCLTTLRWSTVCGTWIVFKCDCLQVFSWATLFQYWWGTKLYNFVFDLIARKSDVKTIWDL